MDPICFLRFHFALRCLKIEKIDCQNSEQATKFTHHFERMTVHVARLGDWNYYHHSCYSKTTAASLRTRNCTTTW